MKSLKNNINTEKFTTNNQYVEYALNPVGSAANAIPSFSF
jgi:hypothetical protein